MGPLNRKDAVSAPPTPSRYTTQQVANIVSVDKSTLLDWVRKDRIPEPRFRDRRGWRVWTEEDIAGAIKYRDRLQPAPQRPLARQPAAEKVHT